MDIKKSNSKSLDYEISNVDANTSQLIRNMEAFQDSSLVLIGKNGTIEYYNSRAASLFELKDSLVTTSDQKLNVLDILNHLARRGDFGPGDPVQFASLAAKLISDAQTDEDQLVQTYLTMPSGNTLRVFLYRNADGTATLSAYDVTEQRRDENMLEIALDIGFAGYLICDMQDHTCRIISRYMSKLLNGEEMQKLQSFGPSSLLHSDDLARSKEMWASVAATGNTERGTLRIVTEKQGVRWLRFALMPQSDAPNCTQVVAFFNDVTESLRQQENLRQAKHLAEESLKTKENFLARMSHEIRTPMNAVIGMADALIHHHDDSKITPQLELIQKSATSILKLLDETLNHSRLDTDSFALDPTSASPSEVVRDVCALWEQQALKNLGTIRCVIKDTVPDSILFDKFRYEQCVNNLLSNAVKFTHGGKIDVVLTVIENDTDTPHLVLAVKDTGIGMTVEQQRHIFEAYAQADNSIANRFGGTGLGMSITKQIVERMGGSISVRSELGSGSMFVMKVPLIEAKDETLRIETSDADDHLKSVLPSPAIDVVPAESIILHEESQSCDTPDEKNSEDLENASLNQTETHEAIQITTESEVATSTSLVDEMLIQAQPEATAYSNLRILVVDDNPTNHLVVKSLLTSVVDTITLAGNGAEALEILDKTPIDIVLMDIHMPVMDGIECTLAIRSSEKLWRDVTIIALTADPNYQQKKLCKNIGMDEALAKPVRLNDLLGAIDAVLGLNTPSLESDDNTLDISSNEKSQMG